MLQQQQDTKTNYNYTCHIVFLWSDTFNNYHEKQVTNKKRQEPLELPHPAGESPGRIQLLERQGRGLSELFDPIKSHATFLITQLGAHGNGGLALLITYGDNVTVNLGKNTDTTEKYG